MSVSGVDIQTLRKIAETQKAERGYSDYNLLLEIMDKLFPGFFDKDVPIFEYVATLCYDYRLGEILQPFVDSQFKTVIEMFCVSHRN